MQEIIGANDDILFDLDQIKRISQDKSSLTDDQRDRIKRLPKRKREEVEKEILAKKEQEKKNFLRIWTLELEDKVKQSGLPPEVVSQILEMTSYAKDRNMTFIYDIERRIEHVKEQVKEAEKKKMEEAMKKDMAVVGAVTSAVIGAVVAGAVLSPYVQARYDKEEFEKRSEAYLDEKILPKLAMADEKPIVPVEPVRTYKKKQGSMYPESQHVLEKKHKDEWMDVLVKMAQDKAKAEGKEPPTPAQIVASYENSTEMEKKTTIRALKKKKPELAAQQEKEEKVHDQAVLAKGIERLRRKKAKKAARIAASKAKKAARENGQTVSSKRPKGARRAGGKQQSSVRPVPVEVIRGFSGTGKTALEEMRKPLSAEQVKREKEAFEKAETEKGIERFKRKQKEKEAKAAKREKARERMREQIALKKARIQSKGPRVAEREKTEKPVTITKETEKRVAPPKRPVVAKEDEKQLGKVKEFAKTPEGMAARNQAVQEQVTENKGPERLFDKGFSKFLAAAQERVQNGSKGLSATNNDKHREIQDWVNKKAADVFKYARRRYDKVA